MTFHRLKKGERGDCVICNSMGINTASTAQWDCPILSGTICETHCAEIQIFDYLDTREATSEIIQWKLPLNEMLAICNTCPFGGSQ